MFRTRTRLFSLLLSAIMVLSLFPLEVLAVGVKDSVVDSLASMYDGDRARAQEELDALFQAGIIDEDGRLVALDVREDGARVELDALAERIARGEAVGAITVNGNASTPEQILLIRQVSSMLELVQLLGEDVEITDAHVQNLEALLTGIADGGISLDDAIETGTLTLMGAGALPETATDTGEVDADENGVYTAPMIDGSVYDPAYAFTLTNPEDATWYADSRYSGAVLDGVVTLNCDDTAEAGGELTVTASLSEAQSVPVSFDYRAVGGSIGASGSGTVTWEAGDAADKTFTVTVDEKGENVLWDGGRAFVVNAANLKNATFADGAEAWSQTVTVEADDLIPMGEVTLTYDQNDWTKTNTRNYYSRYNLTSLYTSYLLIADRPVERPFTVKVSYVNAQKWDDSYVLLYGAPDVDQYYITTSDRDVYSVTSYSHNVNSQYAQISTRLAPKNIPNAFTEQEIVYDDEKITDEKWATFEQNSKMAIGFYCYESALSGNVTNHPSELVNPVSKIEVTGMMPTTRASVTGVSVPAGTYRSGEVVPVRVTFDHAVVLPEDVTLNVNGVACPALDAVFTESDVFTFGYTVRDVDTESLTVTAATGDAVWTDKWLNNSRGTITVADDAVNAVFGVDEGVSLASSGVKRADIDWDGTLAAVDNANPGEQVVTVLLPLNTSNPTWLISEAAAIGETVSLPLPGYADATATHYLAGAFLSCDGGATRYPLYVVNSGAQEGVALAARFTPANNESGSLRRDRADVYLAPEILNAADTEKYLPAWSAAKTDTHGYAYFEASEKDAPMPLRDTELSWYVKGGTPFDPEAFTDRLGYTGEEEIANGFMKLGEDRYLVLQDAEHPENQYDVEIYANQAFYNAAVGGLHVEDAGDLWLSYQVSARDNFTFTAPAFFTWESENEDVAEIVMDEDGVGHVALTGESGSVSFRLVVGNGSASKAYTLDAGSIGVLEGKNPFLSIPSYSRNITTLTELDTDVRFATNIVARNAAMGKGTAVTATLYRADGNGGRGEAVSDAPVSITVGADETEKLGHITLPAAWLAEAGEYVVEVAAHYEGGTVSGVTEEPMDLSADAFLTVKQSPVRVTLDTLDSYYVTSDSVPAIGYSLASATEGVEVQYTVQQSGGGVSSRIPVSGGTIPFSAARPDGLKTMYTITVYARNSEADAWSTDSMLLTVYNADALDLIVADVVAGEIGGTTGGTGSVVDGTTVALGNRGKLADYGVSGESYQLTFEDFNALRTDMSLQKVVSANYGSGVWGLLSDKLAWESSDSDKVSINYEQGGIYADIRNYSYDAYGPATDFLLVGKGDTSEPVTITAVHANNPVLTAEFDVTAETLTDQLYVFQFFPKLETAVSYTNGAGVERTLRTNERGELAVYEPDGITGAVMAMSELDHECYVGTFYPEFLLSGERDIASLQLYPCNNLRLKAVSKATLTFLTPDGEPYNGELILRGGVYKDGVYCPEARIRTSAD